MTTSIAQSVPQTVLESQPHSVGLCDDTEEMARNDPDPKEILWPNIVALMGKQPASIDGVLRRIKGRGDASIGRGTLQRLRDGETSIGVDKLREIADAFNVSVWQLLVPGLTPQRLPRLQNELSTEAVHIAREFDRIQTEEGRAKARSLCLLAISQECGAPPPPDHGSAALDQPRQPQDDVPTPQPPAGSRTLT